MNHEGYNILFFLSPLSPLPRALHTLSPALHPSLLSSSSSPRAVVVDEAEGERSERGAEAEREGEANAKDVSLSLY